MKFFLEGIRQTANNSINTFKSIISLRQEIEYGSLLSLGKKVENAKNLIRLLYSKPVIDNQEAASYLSVNSTTAFRLIEDFVRLGVLVEVTGFKRNRIFVFEKYLKLFE